MTLMRQRHADETEIEYLRAKEELFGIWQAEMLELTDEMRKTIQRQGQRIETLEFHLKKTRDAAYQICFETVGVLPVALDSEKPEKKTRKKAGQ